MTVKSHILVVDDDTALLRALPQALHLQMKQVKVDTSDSALEALEQIQKHDYDTIVSDIKMPGMDGLALLAKIRELRPETPTLLITGHGEHNLAIEALRGGAYDLIQKPIDREYFVAALHRAIVTYQLRRQVHEQQMALELHNRSLEQLVQARTRELVEANSAKDRFLSIVSHELKTPLTNLKGRTQLLRRQLSSSNPKQDVAEVISKGLTSMEGSIARMEILVNDLLDSSFIETNMFVLNRKRCDLVELCRNFLDEYTAGAGPTLSFDYPGKPIEVEVDYNRIGQVLLNLLSNARKYSPQGSPITLTLQQSGHEALLSVRDMGMGIAPGKLDSIFEPCYRVAATEGQNDYPTGLGLGLYISRKIVERHGGHIDVQSVPNQGSVFTVALPLFVDPNAIEDSDAPPTPHTQAVWTIVH
ncbi:MAG: hybrid sensor histidine kinase/response regulator [Ktedonobacteraceae bacterium]|nr:hybrid sensor histidine kinase/response regulator [Ktedonobacteraceae bacterium]